MAQNTNSNLLINGTFDDLKNNSTDFFQTYENGVVPGWRNAGDSQIDIVNNVNGSQVLDLDVNGKNDSIYQDVQTEADVIYNLNFDIVKATAGTSDFQVLWNGQVIAQVSASNPESFNLKVVGTGGQDRLEFRELAGQGSDYTGAYLDNISLTSTGVTTPAEFDGPNLLINGDVEALQNNADGVFQYYQNGELPGWKNSGDNIVEVHDHNGSQTLDLDVHDKDDTIYQDVQTENGKLYKLTFDIPNETAGTSDFDILWNGKVVATVQPDSGQTLEFYVTGTGGNDRLAFREEQGQGDDYTGAYLDNISLKAASDAEPENSAPIIGDALISEVSEDSGVQTVDLLANVSDPDGDAISVADLSVKDDLGNDVAYTDLGNGKVSIDPSQYADLNDGETRTITVTYNVVDAKGAQTSTTAKFIVNGVGQANVAPVIDVDASTLTGNVSEIAAGAEGEGTADVTAEGKIAVSDADATSTDGFSISVEPNGNNYYGNFTAVLAADGSVDWKFTINDSELNPLDEGETASQSYTITVSDGKGGTVSETVTINAIGAGEGSDGNPTGGTITGTACKDVLNGTDGNDVIDALAGDDQINGTSGNDMIDGGEGFDHVQYPGCVDDFTFKLQDDGTVVVLKPDGSTDTLANIEAVYFTGESAWYGMDDLTANHNGDNSVTNGNLIDGVITGTENGDHLMGTDGDDLINLLGGNDAVDGSTGNDKIDGGEGFDHVEYAGTVDDYTFVKNDDGTVTVTKPEGVDTLDNIEAVFFTGDNSWYGMDDLTSNHNGTGTGAATDGSGTDGDGTSTDGKTGTDDGGSSSKGDTGSTDGKTTGGTTGSTDGSTTTDDKDATDGASTGGSKPVVNTIDGSACADFIAGTDGNDLINLMDGNDGVIGSDGNDTINGGSGYDFVRYDGSADDYTFYTNKDGNVTVIKPEGTDTLIDVEGVIFNDEQMWRTVDDVLDTNYVPETSTEAV